MEEFTELYQRDTKKVLDEQIWIHSAVGNLCGKGRVLPGALM
jgi:hypothetical protein